MLQKNKSGLSKNAFSVDEQLGDVDIVQGILSNNIDLFEKLMRRYNNRLFRITRSMLRDDDEAKDVLQESWVKIYTHLHQFKGPEGFGAWASQITRNYCLMRLRKTKSQSDYLVGEHLNEEWEEKECNRIFNQDKGPFEGLAKRQLESILKDAVDCLPQTYRLVFLMRAVEQLSTQETAESLDMTVDVVKQRYSRSKKMLRKQLEAQIVKSGLNLHEFDGKRCDSVVSTVMTKIKVLQ